MRRLPLVPTEPGRSPPALVLQAYQRPGNPVVLGGQVGAPGLPQVAKQRALLPAVQAAADPTQMASLPRAGSGSRGAGLSDSSMTCSSGTAQTSFISSFGWWISRTDRLVSRTNFLWRTSPGRCHGTVAASHTYLSRGSMIMA